MELKSQMVNTSFFFILLIVSHLSLVAPTNTWVGSKYQIECTMCAACDNPCNQPSPSPPPPPAPPICPPPPPPTSSGGGDSGGGSGGGSSSGGGYYYSPPPPSQEVYYYYPPPPYQNYPNPGPPNPITNYYPYYYHSPSLPNSAAVSFSGAAAVVLLINIIFICFFSL